MDLALAPVDMITSMVGVMYVVDACAALAFLFEMSLESKSTLRELMGALFQCSANMVAKTWVAMP